MSTTDQLKAAREDSLKATAGGPPPRTQNPFFGVGPITDMARDEADSRLMRFAFEHWLEQNYRKLDDTGRDLVLDTAVLSLRVFANDDGVDVLVQRLVALNAPARTHVGVKVERTVAQKGAIAPPPPGPDGDRTRGPASFATSACGNLPPSPPQARQAGRCHTRTGAA